jgi:hypothetical protein
MNKYLKMLTVVMLLFVTAFNVSAIDDSAEISTVTIEGIEFDSSESGLIYAPVYLDSTIEVVVEWKGHDDLIGTLEDVEIEIEFDGDEVESEEFDIESNHIGLQVFEIEIADDEDLLDGVQKLIITLNDDNGDVLDTIEIELDIKRERYFVEIFDVNFRNGLQLNAGEIFTASVGVSNEGRENEEDVYVVMSIPELGLSTRTDRFDLMTEDYVEDSNDDDDEYKMYKQLLVNVPLTVPSGVYNVHFKVYFDDGDDYDEKVYSLVVGAGQAYESQISMDTQYQVAGAGNAIVYKVLLENPNVEYDIEVEGLNFGTYEVRTEDDKAYIFVSIDEDADFGEYTFNIVVKAGTNVLEDFEVTTKVAQDSANFSDVKQGLEIGFAVLLVILVILGIVLVAKRLGKGDELEEPMLDEDQTYY